MRSHHAEFDPQGRRDAAPVQKELSRAELLDAVPTTCALLRSLEATSEESVAIADHLRSLLDSMSMLIRRMDDDEDVSDVWGIRESGERVLEEWQNERRGRASAPHMEYTASFSSSPPASPSYSPASSPRVSPRQELTSSAAEFDAFFTDRLSAVSSDKAPKEKKEKKKKAKKKEPAAEPVENSFVVEGDLIDLEFV
eukprot:TRINITY_DN9710_c0_g1_i1.p1 TRINITY_DN9710_c0_g1~~TRINITY_DN9710_c0_g1_i1.p1  ORF type:complete len:197 (+),score=28.14 TRINITY_DN9710_c0_g1_i1:637-1227(+)